MIQVTPQPEYATFNSDVRIPGANFLAGCPKPTSKQFKTKNYWARAANELHSAYAGICAYTAMYLIAQGSVDHFLPKSLHPHLAYEWSNFRLASAKVNSSKADLTDIVDPFQVQNNWFFMDIPTCLLRPNPALIRDLRKKINNTINALRLNQDDNYVQERCNILMDYSRGDVSMGFLQRRYPFLAKEVNRLNLDQPALRTLFKI
ncbi:MAG: hypothetical protein HYU58_11970 [Proteobacteria bacterium]|nr:hypothetical protein [Pseudomonadota bacterium]